MHCSSVRTDGPVGSGEVTLFVFGANAEPGVMLFSYSLRMRLACCKVV